VPQSLRGLRPKFSTVFPGFRAAVHEQRVAIGELDRRRLVGIAAGDLVASRRETG